MMVTSSCDNARMMGRLRAVAWPAKVGVIAIAVFAAAYVGGAPGAIAAAIIAVGGDLLSYRDARAASRRIEQLEEDAADARRPLTPHERNLADSERRRRDLSAARAASDRTL